MTTQYGKVGRIALLVLALCPEASQAQTWTSTGPTGKNILAVAQSPVSANIIYAGAFGWGVFKSSNGGSTWFIQKSGMTNTYVRSILALSDNVVFAGTNDGVFMTVNGGTTWSLSLSTPYSVRSLAYDGATNSLFAATFGAGLYKSTDQGVSWVPKVVSDPVSGESLVHQRAIAVFGANSLYVGCSIGDITLGGALFRSLDGGTSWIQVQRSVGIRSSVKSIAISPSSPSTTLIIGTAAKGVYRSSNGGANWSNIDTSGVANRLLDRQINCVAFGSTQMYAGTDSLAKLYYRGANDVTVGWLSGLGLPGPPVAINAVTIDRVLSSTLYAGTEGRGVYGSTNSGANWQVQSNGMLGIAARVVAVNGNGEILLGTDFGDGIWKSSDQALTWTKVDSLSTSNSITALGTTSVPSIVYAGAYGSGVFKSTDGGVQWFPTDTNVVSLLVRTIAVNPSNSNQVFAGTGNGVYRTDNGGLSWFSLNTGIPAGTSIRSMAMDGLSPSTLYVGTDSSYMYKTTTAGTSWTHITSANGFLPQDIFIRCITVDYALSNLVYAGADSGRIYRSTDAGASWALLSRIPSSNSVRTILIHPSHRNVLFGATFGSGIFLSVDGGAHWTSFGSGLSDQEIYILTSDNANPLDLYAGTGSSGVFRTSYTYVNRPPVLTPIANQSVAAGQQLHFSVSASDPDGTIPTLSVNGLPSGAAFTDSGNGHGGFSWTPTLAQVGGHLLTFIASDGSLSDSVSMTISVLGPGQTLLNLPEETGWNLISVPLVVTDYRTTVLFPTAVSSAFAFHGGYTLRDTLQNGEGYWLKFPSGQTVPVVGSALTLDSVRVDANWNIIGSLAMTISSSRVRAVPPLTRGVLFGFSNATGYFVADSVKPGRAFWVKVNQAGTVVLDTGSSGLALPQSFQEPPDHISLTDARGQARTLFLSDDAHLENGSSELPPPPPGGTLDVRFDTQGWLAVGGSNGRSEYSLLVRDAQFPVTFRWNISTPGQEWLLDLQSRESASRQISLVRSGELVLSESMWGQARLRFLSQALREVPLSFSLKPNFPNPFNPSTLIRYDLPSDGQVSVEIYNVLGQVVATLVDAYQSASSRTVVWNATGVPSGVYFCQLRVTDPANGAVKFKATRKMVLLK